MLHQVPRIETLRTTSDSSVPARSTKNALKTEAKSMVYNRQSPKECAARRRLRPDLEATFTFTGPLGVRRSAPLEGDCDSRSSLQRVLSSSVRRSAPLEGDC